MGRAACWYLMIDKLIHSEDCNSELDVADSPFFGGDARPRQSTPHEHVEVTAVEEFLVVRAVARKTLERGLEGCICK